MTPETAMVLAAGLGTRMKPLTDDRPKALVTVAGRALIDHVLDRLIAAGVKRAVVNVHAFADLLEAHVKRRTDAEDRRATVVRLTAQGRRYFETMARAHEQLIVQLFDDLSPGERRALHGALGTLKQRFRPSKDS